MCVYLMENRTLLFVAYAVIFGSRIVVHSERSNSANREKTEVMATVTSRQKRFFLLRMSQD